jgi:hypothetical protein
VRYPPRLPDLVAGSRELALTVLSSLSVRAAFLAGAPLAGLGTPRSDVDLHVIVDETGHNAEQLVMGNRRIDVRYWTEEQFRARVELCTRYLYTEHDTSQLSTVGRRVIDPVVRFVLGEVLRDDGTLAKLAEVVSAAEPDLVRLIVSAMAIEVENRVEDAWGYVELADERPAAFVSREALLSATEAYLASRGDAYLGQKWVWSRWDRTVGDRLGAPVRYLVTGGGGPGLDETLRRLWLAQDLLLLPIVGAQYPPVTVPGAVRRDPYTTPVTTPDAVLLIRSGRRTARVSRQGALLWAVAHGRTRDEAVRLTHGLLAGAGQQVALTDVDRYYETFAPVGLLTTDGAAAPA